MADAPQNPEPPRIKLNAPGSTPGALPPRIRIKPADKKSDTARIDLSAAQPPASGAPSDFKELTKEELAEFYKKSTIRIDAAQPAADEARDVTPAPPKGDEAMRITMRVDESGGKPGDTHKVQPAGVPTEIAKRVTLRVDGTAPTGDTKKVKSDTQGTTLRVDGADERKKSDTARLEVPAATRTKQSTSRISIDAAASAENEDVFKKRTIPVPVPPVSAPPPARAPTVTLARPKTMQMRAVPPRPSVTPVSPSAVTEARKSETARLDLPPETGEDRPSTRPKTIRIKRPDGTTARKPLMITRPDEAVATAVAQAPAAGGEAQPGALFAVAALLAVLVTLYLIYVLMAQTVAPELPMSGRLV